MERARYTPECGGRLRMRCLVLIPAGCSLEAHWLTGSLEAHRWMPEGTLFTFTGFPGSSSGAQQAAGCYTTNIVLLSGHFLVPTKLDKLNEVNRETRTQCNGQRDGRR